MLNDLNFTFSGAVIRDAHYYEEENYCLIHAEYGNDRYEITLENVTIISGISGFVTGRKLTYYTETPKGEKYEYHIFFAGLDKSIVIVSDKMTYKIF